MGLTREEQIFVDSIQYKIKEYNIKVTIEQALDKYSGHFMETTYNDNSTEVIDAEIEKFLVYNSCEYFARRYAKISIPGQGYFPFELYYVQKKALDEFQENRFNIILKSRQIGFSTLTSIYALWRVLREDKLEVVDVISISQPKSQEFKDRTEETLRNLPLFLFPRLKDKNGQYRYINNLNELPRVNLTELRMPNGSLIKCETASENAGRSNSVSLLVIDEAAFFRDNLINKIWASAFPTLVKTNGDAIIISTPNSLNWYAQRWNEAKNGNSDFNAIQIDWWEIPHKDKGNEIWLNELVAKDYFRKDELRRIGKERGIFEEQNWKENKWLREQRQELGEVLYRQEILHDFIITGDTVFPMDKLEKLRVRVEKNPPLFKNLLGKDQLSGLYIWSQPKKGKRYIAAVDTSKGTGKDQSVVEIFDPENYEQVAEYRGYVSTIRFGEIIKKVARYYNNAYVIIECNGIGESVFNHVYKHQTDPYFNVYKTFITRRDSSSRIATGWTTTPATRKLITDEFINWIADDLLFSKLKIYSERLYSEMCAWIWTEKGPNHPRNATDDCIMAMCIALYCRNKTNAQDGLIIACSNDDQSMFESQIDRNESLDVEYELAEEENYSEEEQKNIKQKDPYFKKYGVKQDDYKWILGM